METFQLHPIGHVRRQGDSVFLEIDEPHRMALRELDQFSHIIAIWWVSGHDNPDSRSIDLTELPYAPGVKAGVFACRAEYRPNPIAITTCQLLSLDEDSGRVDIAAIDAYDNTPLLDIKPYIGVVDRVKDITVPDWYAGWPEWMPQEGIGLYED